MGEDLGRLEFGPRVAEQKGEQLSRFLRRLHAEHDLELKRACVVRGDAGLRLEKHRVDGLRFELAVEDQQIRAVGGKLGADLVSVEGRLGVHGLLPVGQHRERDVDVAEAARRHSTVAQRREGVRRLRGCAGNTDEAMRAIRRNGDGTGLLAVFGTTRPTQGEPRLIERIEPFKDQYGERLT